MARKTKNERVAVTLSPEALKVIQALSDATGQAKSALLAELVDTALPALQTTLEAVRVIQEQPREAQRLIQNFANESVGKLAQASLDLDAAIDARTVKGKRAKKGGLSGRTS